MESDCPIITYTLKEISIRLVNAPHDQRECWFVLQTGFAKIAIQLGNTASHPSTDLQPDNM